jgi:AbrB family looped-hinge helix DNA binding protein
MKHESNMTSKGQITVPKDIRDTLGLKQGSRVAFRRNEAGKFEIEGVDDDTEMARRKSDFLKRLADVRAKYPLREEFAHMDGLEYQNWIRPDRPDD